MMLLLLLPSFDEIGQYDLGTFFLHSPQVAQINFGLCSFFLHSSIQCVVLTS